MSSIDVADGKVKKAKRGKKATNGKSNGRGSSLQDGLQKYFGYTQFKGEQEAIIANLLGRNNTFVIMPTGGGKSMCYQLPALLMDGTAIVVSPLIALMKNQVDSIRGYNTEEGIAHFLNSSLTKAEIAQVKKDIRAGRTKLLYVAPESLTKEDNVAFLKSINISFLAVDTSPSSPSTRRIASRNGVMTSGPSTGACARSSRPSATSPSSPSPPRPRPRSRPTSRRT